MRKLLSILLVVLPIGALLWYAFRPLPKTVDVGQVRPGPMLVSLDHEGRTRVKDLYVIHAPLSGTLRRINLETGDPVAAGETVLAVIDPLEPALLDERAVASAEARVKTSEAAIERSRRLLEKAADQCRLAVADFERSQNLFATNTVSRRELEEKERFASLCEGEMRSAEVAVTIAEYRLRVDQAALLRTRPTGESTTELEDRNLVLRSPIGGRVFDVLRESQGPVTLGDPLLELGDIALLEVVADYLSTDAVRMEPGMEARIHGWGGEQPLTARVRLVEPSGFTKVSALGVEEQRVNVILDLVDPPAERPPLGDGFRVEVSVVIWRTDEALKVPEAALFRRGEGWACYRIVEEHAVLTPITIGRQNGIEAEVLDGLESGDRVVLHASDAIEDGVPVIPR